MHDKSRRGHVEGGQEVLKTTPVQKREFSYHGITRYMQGVDFCVICVNERAKEVRTQPPT